MAIPTITPLPDPPNRTTDLAPAFVTKADAFLAALVLFVTQLNAFAIALMAEAAAVISGVSSVNGETGALTNYVKTTGAQTLASKTLLGPKEGDFTITDAAGAEIDPANGGVQIWVLGANRTAAFTNFAAGHSVTLMVEDGTGYSLTLPGVVWVGGLAPTLPTTGKGIIELWKSGAVLRGAYVGATAS